jgi:hypothetical protein
MTFMKRTPSDYSRIGGSLATGSARLTYLDGDRVSHGTSIVFRAILT